MPPNFYRPQRSWAKVIFSEACVKNSVHGGGCGSGPGGVSEIFSGGSEIFGGGSEIFGGSPIFFFFFFFNFFSPQKIFLGCTPPPPRDGQCAAGTHPTGMHSCFLKN